MQKKFRLWLAAIVAMFLGFTLAACTSDADVASKNISKDADNFKVLRRIVFVNGITDNYIMELQGFCNISVDEDENQLEVTCKLGDDAYKKHYFGLSDNSLYFVEQLEASDVSTSFYKVVFKPSTIVPDPELR